MPCRCLLLFFSLIALSLDALALAPALDALADEAPGRDERGLSAAAEESEDFSAIVALDNCSGAVVRFDHSAPADQALVLTNGHCVELLAPADIIVDRPSSRRFTLLAADASELATLEADRLLLASMTHTDLALYQLKLTYADLASLHGTTALTLARSPAPIATPISVLSGYRRRAYHCAIAAIVPKLQEYVWTWQDAIRYSSEGCPVIPGTSGSPILMRELASDDPSWDEEAPRQLQRQQRQLQQRQMQRPQRAARFTDEARHLVVGINNTVNRDGEACSLHNPCEVDPSGGLSYTQGQGYGQQTYWLYGCLGADGKLDLATPGCRLAP